MRLLILLGGQVFSGAEITTLRFASALPEDWTVEVAMHHEIIDRIVFFGLRAHPWENESLSGDNLLRASHFINEPNTACQPARSALSKIIETFKPDAVLACMFPVAMLALPVLQEHEVPLYVHHQLMYKDIPDHPIIEPVRRVAEYANWIIAASYAVKQPLRNSNINNVKVIHAGLSLDYGSADPSVNVEKPRLFSIGNWGPQKGLDILLKADQILRLKKLDYELTIAGPLDVYNPEYKLMAEALAHESVAFLGNQRNPTACYRNADILIIPSSEPDPYPTVTLEGMAHSLAIVATDCGGLSEQVVHEQTGLLIPTGDIMAMADALQQLITNPPSIEAMGIAGRKRFEEIGNIREQAERMVMILRNVT